MNNTLHAGVRYTDIEYRFMGRLNELGLTAAEMQQLLEMSSAEIVKVAVADLKTYAHAASVLGKR